MTTKLEISTNFPTHYPNPNALWSSLILEELWRLGVRDCCIAPGSRSAPLTLAAAHHDGLKKYIHFDERGLGFFALGLARQSQRPVVVITTSGTAVANLYPAMIEARQSGVPLIAITADRPPELIDCGANQAIEQHAIYGDYPGATVHMPTPSADIPANWVLTSIDQAFAQACQQGLPLHINCMFREPLYPSQQEQDYSEWLETARQWLASETSFTTYCIPKQGAVLADQTFWKRFIQQQAVIVVGRLESDQDKKAITQLAEQLGWPILAGVQSGLQGHPAVIRHTDLLLASRTGKQILAGIDQVLQFGGHIVSKRLTQFLEQSHWPLYVMVANDRRRMDTGHRQTHRFVGAVGETCRSLVKLCKAENQTAKSANFDQVQKLNAVGHRISAVIAQQFEQEQRVSEGWIGASLAGLLPAECGLFLGNSLPVRLVDSFSSERLNHVYTNRGASGIDGLMATAAGCATASEKPFVLVVGDLSFLHDLNSLALANKVKTAFVIILMNNDGGGIFNLLPLGKAQEQAETYFQTPHGLDASGAAAMFNIDYYTPTHRDQFKDHLTSGLAQLGCTLIEVKTMPGEAVKLIRQIVCTAEDL